MKLAFPWKFWKKYFNTKFYEFSFSGSQIVPCGRTDGRTDGRSEGQTDMTKLIIAFRNFANAPNNENTNADLILLLINVSSVYMNFF